MRKSEIRNLLMLHRDYSIQWQKTHASIPWEDMSVEITGEDLTRLGNAMDATIGVENQIIALLKGDEDNDLPYELEKDCG